MRILIVLILALAGCRGDRDRESGAGSSPRVDRGPEQLVLRIPVAGGAPRVFAYPRIDSLVWQGGTQIPRGSRVLGFDPSGGIVLLVDSAGRPARLDLRLGEYGRASRVTLTAPAAGPGAAIFGVADGSAHRFTPTDDWSFKPPRPARGVFPLRDGSIFILAGGAGQSSLFRVFPPETTILDSLRLPAVDRTLRTQTGDVIYFVADRELVGLRTRTGELLRPATFPDTIVAIEASPSGDRLFVLTRGARQIAVYDRFRETVTRRIDLPGPATDLRLGPIGRYILVRAGGSDTAWVVAVGSERMTGAVATRWRADLPFVGADGSIAALQGDDVVFHDAETLVRGEAASGGARDIWFPFRWSGFRPRAAGIDRPVDFEGISTEQPTDTIADDELDRAPRDEGGPPAGWILSFATVLSESRAREVASQLVVEGQRPRVVASERDGVTIYRVLLGPYSTREEAERLGRVAGVAYWVYEAGP